MSTFVGFVLFGCRSRERGRNSPARFARLFSSQVGGRDHVLERSDRTRSAVVTSAQFGRERSDRVGRYRCVRPRYIGTSALAVVVCGGNFLWRDRSGAGCALRGIAAQTRPRSIVVARSVGHRHRDSDVCPQQNNRNTFCAPGAGARLALCSRTLNHSRSATIRRRIRRHYPCCRRCPGGGSDQLDDSRTSPTHRCSTAVGRPPVVGPRWPQRALSPAQSSRSAVCAVELDAIGIPNAGPAEEVKRRTDREIDASAAHVVHRP